jgi:hypothetical protein
MKRVLVSVKAASYDIVKVSSLTTPEAKLDFFRSIVDEKQAKTLSDKGKKILVDMFTASAVVKVLEQVNAANKEKLLKMSPLSIIAIVLKLAK